MRSTDLLTYLVTYLLRVTDLLLAVMVLVYGVLQESVGVPGDPVLVTEH